MRALSVWMGVFLVSGVAVGQGGMAAPEEGDALLDRIRLFDASIEPEGRLSGVLLVARGGGILLHEGFGLADVEFSVPNGRDTRFCVASITKVFTGLVVSQLIAEERLKLEDPLARFVPGFPDGEAITIDHLLRHRAGIPARVTTMSETWRPMSAADVTEHAARAERLFEPGTRSVYSSATYTVLARVVELVEGRPFSEVLRARVFEPAGMRDTIDPAGRQPVLRRARPYVPGRDEVLSAPLQDLSFLAGAGSVVSTAEDLWHFTRAAIGGAFGEPYAQSLAAGFHWTGASSGYHAWVDHDGATDTTFIFTGNSFGRGGTLLREALPRMLAGEDALAPERPPVVSLGEDVLRRYTGRYQDRPGSSWPVEVRSGELMVHDVVALPISERVFWYAPWNSRMTFEYDEASEAWSLHPEGRAAWPRVGDVE